MQKACVLKLHSINTIQPFSVEAMPLIWSVSGYF